MCARGRRAFRPSTHRVFSSRRRGRSRSRRSRKAAQPQPLRRTQPQCAGDAAAAPSGPPPARLTENGGFLLPNVSLTEMIDILAKRMKINYILDPGVKGSVTIYTYGEVKAVDLMPLLETILRVNGATIVQVGDLYRIVPINRVSQLPLPPMTEIDPKTLPDDERMILEPGVSQVRHGRGVGQAHPAISGRRRLDVDLRSGQPAAHPG